MRFPINSTFLEADHFLYVDAINGDDTSDGSELKPFKTMEKAFQKVNDYDTTSSIGIILGDGQYNNGNFTRQTNNTNKIMIIGNTRSELITNGIYSNSVGGDPCRCVVEYYRLIWSDDGDASVSNKIAFTKEVNIYNVVFNKILGDSVSYFLPNSGGSVNIQNCSQNFTSSSFFRTTHGTISVIDSIGDFTSGHGTYQNSWDTGGNIIKSVQFNNEHVPTDTEYKNLGTGTNPDGTLAHVGVYGGQFAWGTWGKFLIYQNNKYYTVINGVMEEVIDINAEFKDKSCILSDIYNNINLINGDFKIISDVNNNIGINGIKTNKEMVVANDDFSTAIKENIDYFECKSLTSSNGIIKIALSIDSGVSWKTYENGRFTDLGVTIPNKKYEELLPQEITQWNDARDIILNRGINSNLLSQINFNELAHDRIRFAYVFSITDMNDIAENHKLIWQFYAKGNMKKMKSSEFDLKVHSNAIEFKSLIDSDMIKINILT